MLLMTLLVHFTECQFSKFGIQIPQLFKRSMSAGYAGVQNPLFFKKNNNMYFGDAKDSLQRLSSELKNL